MQRRLCQPNSGTITRQPSSALAQRTLQPVFWNRSCSSRASPARTTPLLEEKLPQPQNPEGATFSHAFRLNVGNAQRFLEQESEFHTEQRASCRRAIERRPAQRNARAAATETPPPPRPATPFPPPPRSPTETGSPRRRGPGHTFHSRDDTAPRASGRPGSPSPG